MTDHDLSKSYVQTACKNNGEIPSSFMCLSVKLADSTLARVATLARQMYTSLVRIVFSYKAVRFSAQAAQLNYLLRVAPQ